MKKIRRTIFILLTVTAVTTTLVYQFGETWARHLLLYLSQAKWARQFVMHTPPAWQVASRFIAGERIEDAIDTARQLNAKGMHVTLDYLGEHVSRAADAHDARDRILDLLKQIHQSGVNATVSVKLSQLGLHVDQTLVRENIVQLLTAAKQYNNHIRIDMEESSTVDTTLKLFRLLRHQMGFDNVGVVIQSYLYRSMQDVQELIAEGASVRLCKGAYAEPSDIAFPEKVDTDHNFVALTQLMLTDEARQNGTLLGIATHDDKMIQAAIDYSTSNNIPSDAFEFQMLFGVRRELQEALVAKGYQMRIYVPFGTAWYPYFMRRLAERPANLWFFISNFFRR